MNDASETQDARLEGLLRRWGVEQAAFEVVAPPAPVAARPKRSRVVGVIAWFSTVAAAGLLLAAGIFHFAPDFAAREAQPGSVAQDAVPAAGRGAMPSERRPSSAPMAAKAPPATRVGPGGADDAGLAAAVARADEAEKQLAFLRKTQHGQRAANQELTRKLKEADRERTESQRQLARTKNQFDAVRTELATVTGARDKLAGEMEGFRKRLTASAGQLEQLRENYERALASGKKARSETLILKAQHDGLLDDLQRTYLALAGGGLEGLAARKIAVQRANMLRRCGQIRLKVEDTATRRLLDQLEVVLTRLLLLRPGDEKAASAFAELLKGGNLIRQIDQALSAAGADAAVARTLLLEARLILTGADHVG